MRPLLQFAGFCFIVFFIVGELQGWYVGLPPQSPMYLYKQDRVVNVQRDLLFADSFDVSLSGKVREGTVLVEVFHEIPPSFQAGTAGQLPKLVYSEEYYTGQNINLFDSYRSGKGRYTVRMTYEDAIGIFRLKVPNEN